MKQVISLIALFLVFLSIPFTHAQEQQNECNLDFLEADFLDHFADATSNLERLNLQFEFMSFLLSCKEPPDCNTLNTTYAEEIANTSTYDELVLVNAHLTTDIMLCSDEDVRFSDDTIEEIFASLGFTCNLMAIDTGYAYAECTGTHDEEIAQKLYDATLRYLGVEEVFFDVILDDGDTTMEYTFTGTEWLIMEREE